MEIALSGLKPLKSQVWFSIVLLVVESLTGEKRSDRFILMPELRVYGDDKEMMDAELFVAAASFWSSLPKQWCQCIQRWLTPLEKKHSSSLCLMDLAGIIMRIVSKLVLDWCGLLLPVMGQLW